MPQHQKRRFSIGSGKANEIAEAYRAADEVFKVLDLGCGKGRYHEDMKDTLSQIGDKEVEIIGLDYNPEALLSGYQAEEYIVSDAAPDASDDTRSNYLPFKDESFDMVYSSHLFCQLDESELENVRDRAERALKDSGVQFHEI